MEDSAQENPVPPVSVENSEVAPEVRTIGNQKTWIVLIVIAVIAVLGLVGYLFMGRKIKTVVSEPVASSGNVTKLVWAVQWAEEAQQNGVYENGKLKVKGVNQYLDEYNKLHPGVKIELQIIPYNDYANRLKILSDAGAPPDIYQTYSTWAVSYVSYGILDKPPADVAVDVKKNYVSPAGATINGEIWGIPTETDDYCLLYNKDLFKQAGLVDAQGNADYPKNWNDLVSKAVKLTKKDDKGNITQYGIAYLKGNDWQVVDPFLSLLFSNGGQYLASDFKKAMFNSPQGVAALEAQLKLFKEGVTDINGNFYDFGKGTVAMVIAPPWNKTTFSQNFGAKFQESVGVAPIPYMVKPASLQYSWFIGVMAKSQHKAEAWDFLRWMTSEVQPGSGTTRMGDLMAENIGAIPARKVDFNSHKDQIGDFYTGMFVDQMKNSVPEPNVFEASNIKAALMGEIEAAWGGQKTAKAALDSAAVTVDGILSRYYK
jgi:multiple sugar transport system substrate-binding protein